MKTRTTVPRSIFRHAALLGFGVVSLFFACAAPSVTSDKVCNPQEYYYCRCRDRSEGQRVCRDDGRSYGACEPCVNSLGPGDDDDAAWYDEPDAGDDDDASEDAPVPNTLCGNGVVEQGEDCDDNNDDETDGCNTECKLAGAAPFSTNACPGLAVHAWGGKYKPTIMATTVGSGNRQVTPACGAATGAAAPDRIFRVIAHASGTMKVTVTDSDFNVFLWVSATCASDEDTYLACANGADAGGTESVSLAVQAGKTYYVYVDGDGTEDDVAQGDFRLTISIQ